MKPGFAFFFAFLIGCSGGSGNGNGTASDASPTAAAPYAGTWSGTWLSQTGVGGSFTMTLSQSGGELDGTTQFTNSPCFNGGKVTASASDDGLTGSLAAGAILVDMSATVTNGSLNGTYSTVQAGACTGDTGTFSAQH